MSFGKTIRIYLADGTPSGIRHAELVNWTGQAIVCPRGRIAELSEWPESQRPGVYFLLGEAESGKEALYLGEAENVLVRLQNHLRGKDFWSRAVFFTSKDENLTKSHVKYLEAKLIALARAAKRVELMNGNTPQPPSLPRSDRDAMEEFLGPLRVLLGSLGFPFLERLADHGATSGKHAAGEGPTGRRLSFRVPKHGVLAHGSVTDEGFVVFEGSIGDGQARPTMGKGYAAYRQKLIEDGTLVDESGRLRFTSDALFASPSAAASVTSGASYSGRQVWKDEAGRTLKDIEEEIADADDGEAGK